MTSSYCGFPISDAGTIARGFWHHKAEEPLVVSDPLYARHLLGLDAKPPSASARQQHELGLLPVNYFRRATRQLSSQVLRELERLVAGGNVLWIEEFENLVVNQGLNDLLNITIGGNTSPGQDTTWFVGLGINTPSNTGLTPAAGDTLASHATWNEVTAYSGSLRLAWVPPGATTTMSISNAASPAAFTMTGSATIGGSFLSGVNTGTSGRLYAAGAFTGGDKVLGNGDSLSVTATFTTAAP